jgi:hypothetical protein
VSTGERNELTPQIIGMSVTNKQDKKEASDIQLARTVMMKPSAFNATAE